MSSKSLVFGNGFQKCHGWHEEQVSGGGTTEVEQPIIVAGRAADEHVFEHPLGDPRRTVADEIRAEFTLASPAERHVVAQDLKFFPVLRDCGERVVRRRRLDRII
jgi:hypothetical protein